MSTGCMRRICPARPAVAAVSRLCGLSVRAAGPPPVTVAAVALPRSA
ncbi:hypothetical protein [Streptomyces sp. NPDC088246]